MLEFDRIYNSDCIEGMKQIESGKVDLIVTDPPYCISYKTGWRADDHRFSKEILNDDNEQLIIDYMSECYRILKDDSAAYIFCSDKDMQVDHLVPKNRGCYSRWSDKEGKFVVFHGDDSMENYMPSCRSCNLRKRDMSLEQFRSEITRQAKGLLNGKASFQVKMSLAYGLIEEHFDRQIVFYFEKFK